MNKECNECKKLNKKQEFIKNVYSNTTQFTVFTASSCNLRCSYCYHHQNDEYKKLDDEIVQAWKDGTYLKNSLKLCKKLYIDPNNITSLDFWGGETLLHPDVIINGLPEFVRSYPKIKRFSFSTNFLTNIDNTIKFLIAMDDALSENTYMYFQTSIDGPDGPLTQKGHIGSWKVYMENFKKLIFFLNNYKLQHIKEGCIAIKSTVDTKFFLEYFDNDKNILDFMDYMQEKYFELSSMLVNPKFRFSVPFPGITAPLDIISTNDAIKLGSISRRWNTLGIPNYYNCIDPKNNIALTEFYSVFGETFRMIRTAEPKQMGCLKQITDMTMLPDGTLIDCTVNYIHGREKYEEYCKEHNLDKYDTNMAHYYSHFHYNPLKMTEDELYKQTYIAFGVHMSRLGTIHLNAALINELALSGQIEYKYHSNKMLQLEAAKYCHSYAGCIKEHLSTTNTTLCGSIGGIKFALTSGLFEQYKSQRASLENTVLGDLYTDYNFEGNIS